MNARRGYSLTELMAAMSVGTVILGLATGTVHRVMLLSSQFQDQHAVHQVALRLSERFRRDVHRSEDAKLDRDGHSSPSVILSAASREDIRYQIKGSRLICRQSIGDAQNHEVYDFPSGYAISLSQPQQGFVRLTVQTEAKPKGSPAKMVLSVAPEVGRLLQLSKKEDAAR